MRWNCSARGKNESFSFVIDAALSTDCYSALNHEFSASVQKNSADADIITSIKKTFSVVKSISIAYCPSGALVKIVAHKPVLIVNDLFVMADNNELFARSFFSDYSLAGLPCVSVAQESMSEIICLLPDLLRTLPEDFTVTYDVYCIDKNCIKLTDKNNSQFTIIFSADQSISESIFAHCEKVKKNIMGQGSFDKGALWAADIRFANYIVAYKV